MLLQYGWNWEKESLDILNISVIDEADRKGVRVVSPGLLNQIYRYFSSVPNYSLSSVPDHDSLQSVTPTGPGAKEFGLL
jgi:hypothetical protein